MIRKSCFPPVVDARTRILILGSLPGEVSLATAQYYAHPQNKFWELVGGAIGVGLRALPYPERLAKLRLRGVGLWDVIADAERRGSLDGAIRDEAPNDLAALAATLPRLEAVAFNGGKAAKLGRARLGETAPRVTLVDLPSSSSAYAGMPLPGKMARWRVIGDIARGGDACDDRADG